MNPFTTDALRRFDEKFVNKITCMGCLKNDCDYSTTGCPSYRSNFLFSQSGNQELVAGEIKSFITQLLSDHTRAIEEAVVPKEVSKARTPGTVDSYVDAAWNRCRFQMLENFRRVRGEETKV